MRLAATEYGRYLDQLRTLDPADWALPTDCPAWDVRAMATHNLGMAEMVASFREMVRQNVAASRRTEKGVDALTAVQVDERAAMGAQEIIARYAAVAPRAVAGRRRRAALLGRVPAPGTEEVDGVEERWAFGYLFETILTRDTWMHRVDTALATGRAILLTGEHDGVIVADVVAEWAARHGQPYSLRLTGPAGGTWSLGAGGDVIELDTIEFCRILSGRAAGDGLLNVAVPF